MSQSLGQFICGSPTAFNLSNQALFKTYAEQVIEKHQYSKRSVGNQSEIGKKYALNQQLISQYLNNM